MAEDPDWAKVLRELYEEESGSYLSAIHDKHPLVDQTDLDEDEVEKAIDRLKEWDLVEKYVPSGGGYTGKPRIKLRKEGFRMAHDRALYKQERRLEKQRAKREEKRDTRERRSGRTSESSDRAVDRIVVPHGHTFVYTDTYTNDGNKDDRT